MTTPREDTDTDMTTNETHQTNETTETTETNQTNEVRQEDASSAPPADAATQADAPTTEATGAAEEDATDRGVTEAKKYRRRAQAAEAERDALAERLNVLQRAEVGRLAERHLARGSDLFTLGEPDVGAYLDDDGHVDPEKVAGAVRQLMDERPYLGHPVAVDIGQGNRGGRPSSGGASWGDVLRQ